MLADCYQALVTNAFFCCIAWFFLVGLDVAMPLVASKPQKVSLGLRCGEDLVWRHSVRESSRSENALERVQCEVDGFSLRDRFSKMGFETFVRVDVRMEQGFESGPPLTVSFFDKLHGCPRIDSSSEKVHRCAPFPLDRTF